jgi:hypothetical protein
MHKTKFLKLFSQKICKLAVQNIIKHIISCSPQYSFRKEIKFNDVVLEMLQPQKISTFVENKHYVKKKIIMEKLDLLVCKLSNANFEFNILIIIII